MQWARRLGGLVAAVILFLHGLPGFVDDSAAWHSWITSMNLPTLVYPIGIVGGLLLGTSEWWYPQLRKVWDRVRRVPTALALPNEDLVRFRECLPHVQRCRKLISPYTGTLGTADIALQVFRIGSAQFGEIATEVEYLAKQFRVLGIPSPEIWGDGGEDDHSFSKVHSRLRSWSSHLAWLEAKIHQEDLQGARFQEE